MIAVVAVLILVVVLIYVGYPVLSTEGAELEDYPEWPEHAQMRQLIAQRESTLAILKELDLDHAIGNLSDEDYHELTRVYRHKATAVLRALDEDGVDPKALGEDVENVVIEAEIARARAAMQAQHRMVDGG